MPGRLKLIAEHLKRNMLKAINILIVSIFLNHSCARVMDGNDAISAFVSSFEKEIYKDYGFNVFGSGASFPVKIEDIIIFFQADFSTNINGARQIAVPIALRFVEKMNQDQNLQPYLANYPATVKNIMLTIGFRQENPANLNQNNCLHSVMIIGLRNNVHYNVYDERGIMLIDLHKETFDEALEIIQQESE